MVVSILRQGGPYYDGMVEWAFYGAGRRYNTSFEWQYVDMTAMMALLEKLLWSSGI